MVEFSGFSITSNIEELLDVLWRRKRPKRVHCIELFHDPEVIRRIADRFILDDNLNKNDPYYSIRLNIAVHRFLGFEVFYIPTAGDDHFKLKLNMVKDTAFQDTNRGEV